MAKAPFVDTFEQARMGTTITGTGVTIAWGQSNLKGTLVQEGIEEDEFEDEEDGCLVCEKKLRFNDNVADCVNKHSYHVKCLKKLLKANDVSSQANDADERASLTYEEEEHKIEDVDMELKDLNTGLLGVNCPECGKKIMSHEEVKRELEL